MTSLFGDWAGGELAQIFFQEEVPESIRFRNFFRVRDIDILKKVLFLKPQGVCGESIEPVKCIGSHRLDIGFFKNLIVRQLKKANSVKLLARDLVYGTGLWRSANFLDWVGSFSPEVIFFVGGNSVFSFRISLWLSDFYRIPLDVYITDDYVVNARPKGVLARYLHASLLRIYRSAFSRARNVFVIGEDMADVFSRFFGRECVSVMNSVAIPNEFFISPLSRSGKVDFVYAGGLHLGRDAALVAFSDILKRVSDASGRECSLTIYSSQNPSSSMAAMFNKRGIVFGGALRQDDLKARLAESDFVLHAESFDKKYVELTNLSVSTKIPECLVSGSCLVAYGPRELASIKLVEKYGVGICLSEQSVDGSSEANLVKAVIDGEFRSKVITDGFEFARRKFDEVIVREKFNNLVNRK